MIQPEDPRTAQPPPIPNSYWVRPGRLLAGEYPGLPSRTTTLDRIQRLLAAGVTTFIDLTCDGELVPYEPALPHASSIEYQRWPITDHGLPESPEFMAEILDAIDAALAAGRCVYVHCRAGIGRTGTTIGCHLIRSGLEPDAALDRLQRLWQQNARSETWLMTPETDEQFEFVRQWREPEHGVRKGPSDFAQRCEAALLGLACGESLGALFASGRHEAQELTVETLPADVVLELGSNAGMTICVAQSLLERSGHDAADQMRCYLQWSRGMQAAALPADFRRALASWQWSRKANAGSHDPKNLDPHSLARSLAPALYLHHDPVAAGDLAADVSRTTQQSPVVLDLCRVWAALSIDALAGASRKDLLSWRGAATLEMLRTRRLRSEINSLLEGRWQHAALEGTDAVAVCARALFALANGDDFVQGMRLCLGGSAPHATVCALYGALAGARFGIPAIPASWQWALPQQEALRALARRFA